MRILTTGTLDSNRTRIFFRFSVVSVLGYLLSYTGLTKKEYTLRTISV